jgi:hypothetical protein
MRTWSCCAAGKTSITRSIVLGALCVCSVARLGRGQRGRDRLEVAHLAEEDHVGVLAERRPQRF